MTSSHNNGQRKCPKFKRGCSSCYYLQTVYNVLMLMYYVRHNVCASVCVEPFTLLTFHTDVSFFFPRVVSYDLQLSHFVG